MFKYEYNHYYEIIFCIVCITNLNLNRIKAIYCIDCIPANFETSEIGTNGRKLFKK